MKFTKLDEALYQYLLDHCTPVDDIVHDLVAETSKLGTVSAMQVALDQAALLTLLTRIRGARQAVEVGTFTGLSALAIARGLAPDGHLLCCDVSEEWTAIAHRTWERAGVADRITLRIAPAIETLRGLPADFSIDIAFIDADKTGYRDYYEEILVRMPAGGIVLLDNVLWMGSVIDPTRNDADTRAIRAFNDFIATDDRVDCVMLPVSDGLTLAVKR
ncbi:MAG: O-methyltransferase [Candidatus Binatia bacterium]